MFVIEEDEELLPALVAVLRCEGYEVLSASDGTDALRTLAHGPTPDLILLDEELPHMNGAAFRAIQRQSERWAHVPVVVVSAFAAAADADRLGVADVLEKPFNSARLLTAVKRHRLGGTHTA